MRKKKWVMKINVDGKRGKERSKKKWMETIEYDMRVVSKCVGDVNDSKKWRLIPNSCRGRQRR